MGTSQMGNSKQTWYVKVCLIAVMSLPVSAKEKYDNITSRARNGDGKTE
jgi:hypothetical protein